MISRGIKKVDSFIQICLIMEARSDNNLLG